MFGGQSKSPGSQQDIHRAVGMSRNPPIWWKVLCCVTVMAKELPRMVLAAGHPYPHVKAIHSIDTM